MNNFQTVFEALAKLEKFRQDVEAGKHPGASIDWIIRVCQAFVAEEGPWDGRDEWVSVIKDRVAILKKESEMRAEEIRKYYKGGYNNEG